jgi:tetratricopeptide (TPR) repeat protein
MESKSGAETQDQIDALRSEGLRAADTAIRLDRSNSEALAVKSSLIDPADLSGREALLRRAMKARPLACGCEHLLHGYFLYDVGRIRDALAQFRRSTEVIALDPDSQFAVAEALVDVGEMDEARQHFDVGIGLSSDPTIGRQIALWYAPFTGDYQSALEAARDPNISLPASLEQAMVASYEALMSKDSAARSKALALLVAIPDQTGYEFVIPLLGALGANLEATRRVEAAAAIRKPGARSFLFVPSMAGALRDPSFPAVAQRLGLMKYWRASRTRPDVCATKGPPPFCRMI